jgi:hypothetical protein
LEESDLTLLSFFSFEEDEVFEVVLVTGWEVEEVVVSCRADELDVLSVCVDVMSEG